MNETAELPRRYYLIDDQTSLVMWSKKAGHEVDDSGYADAGLSQVIEAWPALPPAIRAGILAMVKAAKEGAA